MYLGLIVLVLGIAMLFSFGIGNLAYASNDSEQFQYNSVILPPDMKKKNFEEFMEWCVPKLGGKCTELYEKNNDSNLLSPLKQFRSGISLDEIQCRDSLTLVTKHDGSPACIKPETRSKLVQRDWIKFQFSFCGADGIDALGNLNQSNSTHTWDENYCEWKKIDRIFGLDQEQKVQLQIEKILDNCNVGGATTATLYKFSNSTHYIDSNICEWQKDSVLVDILDRCEEIRQTGTFGGFAYGASWQNGTHYIDNDSCKWEMAR